MRPSADGVRLQVGVGELGEKSKIDIVLGKPLCVLTQTQLLQPISYLLHGAASSDYRA
jgi:hypothetical protein